MKRNYDNTLAIFLFAGYEEFTDKVGDVTCLKNGKTEVQKIV